MQKQEVNKSFLSGVNGEISHMERVLSVLKTKPLPKIVVVFSCYGDVGTRHKDTQENVMTDDEIIELADEFVDELHDYQLIAFARAVLEENAKRSIIGTRLTVPDNITALLEKSETEEPLTLEEQREAQRQLDDHLDAVYERNDQLFLEEAKLFAIKNKKRIVVPVDVNETLAGTPMPNKEKGSASATTDPVMQQQVSGVSSNYSLYDDDLEALFNLRDWLQSCLEHGNAKITGGGIGFGGADLVFELDGYPFYVECRPRKKYDNR